MSKRVAVLLTAILLMSSLAAACSDDDDSDNTANELQGAEQDVCNDIDKLDSALNNVRDLDSSSTVDDAVGARDDVQEALNDLKESAGQLGATIITALEAAYAQLSSSIDDVQGSDTLDEAATQIQSDANRVATAEQTIQSQLGCE